MDRRNIPGTFSRMSSLGFTPVLPPSTNMDDSNISRYINGMPVYKTTPDKINGQQVTRGNFQTHD